MIDWQVQVNGDYPPDWERNRDGCWFPDFAYQEYMLPYFDVGSTSIDPYHRTEFQGADLEILRESLQSSTAAFADPPKLFALTEHSGYGSTKFSLDPLVMMPIVKRTLEMIQYATEKNGMLVFLGDWLLPGGALDRGRWPTSDVKTPTSRMIGSVFQFAYDQR